MGAASLTGVPTHHTSTAGHGLTIADVQRTVSCEIGGEIVTENIEGREPRPLQAARLSRIGGTGQGNRPALKYSYACINFPSPSIK